MSTGRLQDFAASVITRGQVTFGDVRRLQRDYLPGGITNREDAELLIALGDKLVRADRAWAQWLVAALARYLASRERSDASIQDVAKAWLESLPGASPAATRLGRRIGRHIRRELTKLMAPEMESAEQPLVSEPQPAPVAQACPAAAPRVVRRLRCSPVARQRRRTAPPTILPVEVWSAGMMERHQRFQLERPYI
jgi:hypothetical protein